MMMRAILASGDPPQKSLKLKDNWCQCNYRREGNSKQQKVSSQFLSGIIRLHVQESTFHCNLGFGNSTFPLS
jgi:hypothetical protein